MKSLKLSNGNYLDSSSVIESRVTLDEKLNGTVLYESEDGTNEDITLNDDASNYSYMEIFYRDDSNTFSTAKVYSPNGKQVALSISKINSTKVFIKMANVLISSSSLTWAYYAQIYNATSFSEGSTSSGELTSNATSNTLYIFKVMGYK